MLLFYCHLHPELDVPQHVDSRDPRLVLPNALLIDLQNGLLQVVQHLVLPTPPRLSRHGALYHLLHLEITLFRRHSFCLVVFIPDQSAH